MSAASNIFSALQSGYCLQERFQIDSVLALGGFSIVYRALDLATNESIVLKECAPEGYVVRDAECNIIPLDENAAALYQKALQNSVNEAYILADLTQRGVQGITGYVAEFQVHNSHYIAMQQANGHDLHSWAHSFRESKTPFPISFLMPILTQLLDILHTVHEAGYYHCDIKPANIIVDNDANVCLIDFGATRTEERQSRDSVAISPGFSPPEFYPGQIGKIGAWTDMYMLAALLYNILSNRVPDSAEQRAVVDRNPRLSVDAHLVEIYPSLLLASIDKAMSVNPKERFYTTVLWKEYYQKHANLSKVNRVKKKRGSAALDARDMLASGTYKKKHNKNLLLDEGHRSACKAGQPPAKASAMGMWFIMLLIIGGGLYYYYGM